MRQLTLLVRIGESFAKQAVAARVHFDAAEEQGIVHDKVLHLASRTSIRNHNNAVDNLQSIGKGSIQALLPPRVATFQMTLLQQSASTVEILVPSLTATQQFRLYDRNQPCHPND